MIQVAFILRVITLLFLFNIPTSQPVQPVKIIIDADTANELDDLFALAGAMANPKFDIKGITSAQFHTSILASDSSVWESQQLNEDLVRLTGRRDIPLPLGANGPLLSSDQPERSPASDFIVRQARELANGDSLTVVILGSCTNVASAILQDPSILPKLRVHYLGVWHDPETNAFDLKEFNSGNDTLAANFLLGKKGLDLTIMSATTSQHLVFDKDKSKQELGNNGELGTYLMNRWETFHRWWAPQDTIKQNWVMWDIAILEAIAHPDLVEKKSFDTPAHLGSRPVHIYTQIDHQEMERRYWLQLDQVKN